MAKEVKLVVPRDKVPFDPWRTIRKIQWSGTKNLSVSLQIFPEDSFLVSASGSISINGIAIANVLAFPPVSAGCGGGVTPAQMIELFAPEPVPDSIGISFNASWFCQDALLIPRNGFMSCSADTDDENGPIDHAQFEVSALSGGSTAFTLAKATYLFS
jgi:hypothetical protein